MNGFITKNTLRLCFSAFGLVSLIGCYQYRDLVDPCWPERYNSMARHSVREMHFAQAEKGHMLEQTVWNWYFEREPDDTKVKDAKPGDPTARLNPAGMEVLRRISRTLPAPDFQLFLQNAQDVKYDAKDGPETIVAKREKLNRDRIDSILRFLATQPTPGAFQVAVHDFAPTSLRGEWPGWAIERQDGNLKGAIRHPFAAPDYSTK